MTTQRTALGSAGARRVLGASIRVSNPPLAYRVWPLGYYVASDAASNLRGHDCLSCYPDHGRSRWRLNHEDISRATARLLLTGLLHDGAVREFVEWVRAERDASTLGCGCRHEVCCDVLAKLKEMGVPT